MSTVKTASGNGGQERLATGIPVATTRHAEILETLRLAREARLRSRREILNGQTKATPARTLASRLRRDKGPSSQPFGTTK
jgi:hypothetical protein